MNQQMFSANYQTFLPRQQPVTPQMQANALRDLGSPVPHPQYGSPFGDIMRARGAEGYEAYRRAGDLANTQHGTAFENAQQGLALQGLQNQAQDFQRQNQLETARLGNMRSLLSSLL